jgi:hypothetical protein
MEVRHPAGVVESSSEVGGGSAESADSEQGGVVIGKTMHHLTNASNIGGNMFDWVYGASRFPKPSQSACHHFFGELANLHVWNGVGCTAHP